MMGKVVRFLLEPERECGPIQSLDPTRVDDRRSRLSFNVSPQVHHPQRTLLLIPLLLSGCVPLPNIHYRAPAVAGLITEGGKPAVGATVKVSGQFSSAVRVAISDQDGRFITKPIRELFLTATLLGDPLYGYTVGIVADGKEYVGYSIGSTGYAPKAIQLVCDLTQPIVRGRTEIHHCTEKSDDRQR